MAFVVADRVSETTTSTGTGTVTLNGAAPGYQSFAAIGTGNSTYYCITDNTSAWEVGIGTYTASGTTLSRDTVLASSNAGSLVSFAAGSKDVFCTGPAEGVALGLQGMVLNANTISANVTIPAGFNALSAGPVVIANNVTVTVPTGSTWTVV